MTKFYTRTGDAGYTGLLGEGRVPKYHPRMEALGTLDEASAALGMARSICRDGRSMAILTQVQRDLYQIMSEVAATPENALRFQFIGQDKINWLEQQIEALGDMEMPGEFILPGDSQPGAAMAVARSIVRRAERRLAVLIHSGEVANSELLKYVNRLSSLCFALELLENQASGKEKPTLAKIQNQV